MKLALTEFGLKGRIALVVDRGVYAEAKGNRYITAYRRRVEHIELTATAYSPMHNSAIRDDGLAKAIVGGER